MAAMSGESAQHEAKSSANVEKRAMFARCSPLAVAQMGSGAYIGAIPRTYAAPTFSEMV
jgi:hypothetical protein